jgi:hypothetical protein
VVDLAIRENQILPIPPVVSGALLQQKSRYKMHKGHARICALFLISFK